jgi:hypothetical protein
VRGCKVEVEKQYYVSDISLLAVGMSRIGGGKDVVRPAFIKSCFRTRLATGPPQNGNYLSIRKA